MSLTARVLHDISEIEPEIWDACATSDGSFNPFLCHRFLLALETSGSATKNTGWYPFHLALEDGDDTVGVIPMYLKGHSQGEYVFDYAWADAFQRAGGQYYPKLQSCIPFTPATGRRLLCHPNHLGREKDLLGTLAQVVDEVGVSSAHITFMPESQWQAARDMGYLARMDQQFHWQNSGYDTFDDFLAALSSKKRKNLKRERRDAVANGIEIERLTGDTLTDEHFDAFYQFYLDTGARKWGSPYLTRAFFSEMAESFAEHTLLIMAKRDGRYIAGALNFIGSDTLFGRNWGCIEDHRFLHFEVCYYQAIEYAIERGLSRVEAGAQGSHKVARGYEPTATYSAHWIADGRFRTAVENFLENEREYVQQDIEWGAQHTPFKRSDNGASDTTA